MKAQDWEDALQPRPARDDLCLGDGSRVAVVGGGPAGSLFAYFLLDMAQTMGMAIDVELFEPRNFARPGPQGCNMCGGIISETLVQNLATEGINLPTTVVQRGIDSYVLHMDVGSVRLATPLQEMRIGAVTRGSGARDIKAPRWDSFDDHLLQRAVSKGGHVTHERVEEVTVDEGRPCLKARGGEPQAYDLVAVAVGVNSPSLKLFEALGLGYERPQTTKTLIREYFLGQDVINEKLGPSMHVFLLDIPRLKFAAIIPKGDYVTLCLLGEEIDNTIIDAFVNSPEVRACMPEGWKPEERSCQCMPRMNVIGVEKPYADRVVFIGDCGITRLYKDGIGAAYRTAKAAARTAVFEGISEAAWRRYFYPSCRKIARDNFIGKVTFGASKLIQKCRFSRRAILDMTIREQARAGRHRRMSGVLWDMFTGSAPYTDVFVRSLHPAFLGRLTWSLAGSILPARLRRSNKEAP